MMTREDAVRHVPVEEMAEEIWALREEGRNDLDTLLAGSKLQDSRATLDEMLERRLARRDGDRIQLTAEGEGIARQVVRRHRLAEVLLQQVLEVEAGEAERTACEFEHMLSEAVTDSVCTYMGHPPSCPHGKAIPKGRCCDRLVADMAPLVVRLTDLRPGEEGRIVFMQGDNRARLQKLASMGVVPGRIVRLDRKWPSVVIKKEEISLALDQELGREIFVKKIPKNY
jgi:DtxR family Mn-dependent transcriptional regulator